jgi:protein-disulfide isomerase
MKRFAIRALIAGGLLLGFSTTATIGCVAPPAKTGTVATGGKFVTMDQVDDSLNDKVVGDRYQITYEENDLWHGAPDGALVTIVEYSDFQCPYCSRLADSLKQISEEYPDDVRVVFKHFPLQMHAQAKPASEAVLAAHGQGKGWEMHDLVFENARALTNEDLIRYAEQVGVPDMAKFKQDLEGHTYGAQVDADLKQGQNFGVGSTPSFFLNGIPHRGTKSPEQLKQLIEEEKQMAQALIDAGSKREEVYARILRAGKTSREAPKQDPKAAKGKQKQGPRAGKPDPAKSYAVPTEGRPQKGLDTALVTIVEYSDFECPYCRKVLPTLKQIEEKYGENVRVVFRQQPLPMHKNAVPSALAALAAHRQGKFWEMHDALFAKSETKALNEETYIALATELQLDVEKFNADRKDPALQEMIAGDQKIAMQFGAGGTPAFFVNGRPLSGAQPFEVFDALVTEELAKAQAFMAANKVEPEKLYEEMSKNWEIKVEVPPVADHTRRAIDTSGLAGKGNLKDPKLTLIECSDFDCPYCTRGAELVDQIFAHPKYKDITAFYFANFPLPMHKNAEGAHRAAIAAGYQNKFFEMHDLLFADKNKRTEADYKDMAAQLGLDVTKFMADWNSEATKQRIVDDKALCAKFGVSGTPNFFINGRSMRGAVPINMAEEVFEEELSGGFEAKAAAAKLAADGKPADGKAADGKAADGKAADGKGDKGKDDKDKAKADKAKDKDKGDKGDKPD